MPNWRRWHAQLLDHLILIGGALVMTLPVYSIFAATTHEGGRVRPRLDLERHAGKLRTLSADRRGLFRDVTALSMMWNSFLLGAGFATLRSFCPS